MPWYRMRTDMPGALAGGTWHLKGDKRHTTPPCSVCRYIGSRRCDRIVNHDILRHGEPKRCDRWLCSYCTFEPEPGKDLCPRCVQLYKGWLAARTNSTDGEGP
jgi:hypothetical protein